MSSRLPGRPWSPCRVSAGSTVTTCSRLFSSMNVIRYTGYPELPEPRSTSASRIPISASRSVLWPNAVSARCSCVQILRLPRELSQVGDFLLDSFALGRFELAADLGQHLLGLGDVKFDLVQQVDPPMGIDVGLSVGDTLARHALDFSSRQAVVRNDLDTGLLAAAQLPGRDV